MAPHSSTLAWKIPWTEEPGRLQSMGSQRVWHDRGTSLSLFTFMHWRRKWQPTPVFLPGEPRDGGAWWAAVYGLHRVGHDWSDLAAAAAAGCTGDVQLADSKAKREDFPGRPEVKYLFRSPGNMGSIPGPERILKPQSSYASVPQLLCQCSRAHERQLLKPLCLEPVLRSGRSHCNKSATAASK